MVPFSERAEWYQEWISELWHVRRECVPVGAFSWTAERELTAFCMGSFQDAACMRLEGPQIAAVSASMHGSARQCVLSLCCVLALCVFISRFEPGIQTESEAVGAALPPGVIVVSAGEYGNGDRATIPFIEYEDWNRRQQRFFSDLAFYHVEKERVQGRGREQGAEWRVAHATANLGGMLGAVIAPLRFDTDGSTPHALLSRSMWRHAFRADPEVIGREITIANRVVRVAGIAPPNSWQLPGNADLWLLENSTEPRISSWTEGYVVALLSSLGRADMDGDTLQITAYGPDGDLVAYHGMRPAPATGGPLQVYVFALFLAILALPAITCVFQSETEFSSHKPSLKARVKRSAFMAAKMGLVAAIGYFAGLDLAYWNFADYSSTGELLQFAFSFCICLFGLRWALMDQSRRCPVCLRLVTHPAQVGIASRTFLGWNGTEMICTGGHALLHVPSLPTSWFSRQRWMYLDTSWDFLFAETPGPL